MKAQKILAQAADLVGGDRQADYGPPEENFNRIARLWSVVLKQPVSAYQVALCMAQVKVARLVESPEHSDSWVDGAAYMGLGGQLAEPSGEGDSVPVGELTREVARGGLNIGQVYRDQLGGFTPAQAEARFGPLPGGSKK